MPSPDRPNARSPALPVASGATVASADLAQATYKVLKAAGDLARTRGDSFVSTEHVLIALAAPDSATGPMLAAAGVTPDALSTALDAARAAVGWTPPTPRAVSRPWRSSAWTSPPAPARAGSIR